MIFKIANFRQESIVVWIIISIVTAAILILPLIITDQLILEISPTCSSIKKYNKDCIMCGMTRAFIQISHANFLSAQRLNKGSIVLYCSFLSNLILFCIFWTCKIFKPTGNPLDKLKKINKT